MARLLTLLLACALPLQAAPSLESRVQASVEKGRSFLLAQFDREKGWGEAKGTGTYNDVGLNGLIVVGGILPDPASPYVI